MLLEKEGPPLVTVIIPVKNGAGTLDLCLKSVVGQSLGNRLEILVIDSGSTDGTLDLVSGYPVRLHRIRPEEFTHGETRNLGARLARGELVAMTVQDARPADERWLEKMVRHFQDPKVAGVCGQQIVPHDPDKNPLQWFRPCSEPVAQRIQFPAPTDLARLTPADQLARCAWDDVTAMYRRSVLLKLPFRPISFSEDLVWARDALSCGYALVYDYSARVYHYHHQSFGFRFRRMYTVYYHAYRFFGSVPKPGGLVTGAARAIYRASRRKYCPERRAYWMGYNLRLVLSQCLAYWSFFAVSKLGGQRAAERGHELVCATPPEPARIRW